MIPIQQALDGLSSWAVNDVISSMPDGVGKFVALMSVGAMRNSPGSFISRYSEMLKGVGILSDDGAMVDGDALRAGISEAFGSMQSLSALGFTFTASDADRLYRRLGI